MPSGGVRLSGGPVLSEGEASILESDVSSIIDISDRYLPSDTEADDGTHDKAKYRLPDPGKTRLHLRTKEPLSPTARPVPRSPTRRPTSTATTPQATQSSAPFQSPVWPGFPMRNGSSESIGGLGDSDFASRNISRADSIYTLGRASLQGQLAHLTSLKLPDPTSLAKKISSIPSSLEAAKALSEAADQIRIWISKASDVLNSLNAEDDVEWAAAGGKDGIEDVDTATNRFQNLVEVYVGSIDRLQTRKDACDLSSEALQYSVQQMKGIIGSWQKVKDLLDGVKTQVEIAIEWEELWNTLLGEIGQEMDGLNQLVFEMEEKRHSGAGSLLSSKDSIDLHELETIVEERPGQGARLHSHRLSLPGTISAMSPVDQQAASENKDDASLLALFARMQPLRASLDFLPMRLATFKARGDAIFPSACIDLENRRDQLEQLWKKLEADAESLRRELGEDRWVLVFRNAGRQALKMEESITRSFNKLKEAVDGNEHQLNATSFLRKVESYDAKKAHYGPAIERVLAIIDRGVKERLTVNGEILRLQGDMKQRWSALQQEMMDMNTTLEELNNDIADKQFRDSVSTIMSSERSVASSLIDTPGSSPASSVVGGASGNGSRTPTPLMVSKNRRVSSRIPSSIPRRIPLTQSGEFSSSTSSPLTTRSTNRISLRPEPATASRPRWQTSTRSENRDFLPLSALEPSPYAKSPSAPKYANYLRSSSNPMGTPNGARTPLSRKTSTPNLPSISTTTTPSAAPPVPKLPHTARKSGLPVPSAHTTPARPTLASRKSHSTLRSTSQHSSIANTNLRQSIGPAPPLPPPKFTDGNDADTESPAHHAKSSRSGSAMSNSAGLSGRRSSMLPARARGMSGASGDAAGDAGRPRWRP